MLLIFPVSYEVKTELSPKTVARKLDRLMIEHRPTVNIMSNGRFMREHRFENCFYGCRTSLYEFQVYHHKMKKRDGGSTGFFGKIEETKDGSVIRGSFRKPVYTYVIAVIWLLITLLLTLVLLGLKENIGALCVTAVMLFGIFIMFWDNKKPLIKAFLDSFSKQEQEREK